MSNPDEEITMRQADVEHTEARLVAALDELQKWKNTAKQMAEERDEARELAEAKRNEVWTQDPDECARHEEPLPWEPEAELDDDELERRKLAQYYEKGCRDFHTLEEQEL